jgi:RNA polymerase sigma factor (sigma-70 family)
MSDAYKDTKAFVLIGYDLPFGQLTGPAVPIGRVGRRRFAVIRDSDGHVVLSPLPGRCKFTRLTRRMATTLAAFDYRAHQLFVRDGSEVLRYVASEEAEFFTELLNDESFLAGDQYFRLSLAKASHSPVVILRALLDCVRYRESRSEEYVRGTNDRWYEAERRTILGEFSNMNELPSTFEEAVLMSRVGARSTQEEKLPIPSPMGWRPDEFGREVAYLGAAALALPAGSPRDTSSTGEALFLHHLQDIRRAIAFVCRRHHVSPTDADDFSASVILKMIQNDYSVLRRFKGSGSLRTFLFVVIERMLLDSRAQEWGRWRPSAEARRRGPLAIRLETLLMRENFTFEEAYEVLKTDPRLHADREELARLAAALPVRVRRRFELEGVLRSLPAHERPADELVSDGERREKAERVSRVLEQLLASLDVRDRLILRMHLLDRRTILQIARASKVEDGPREVYRRLARLLVGLRNGLEAEGIDAVTVRDLLSGPELLLELALRPLAELSGPPGSKPPDNR